MNCSHDAVRNPEEKQCRLCIFELDELADCRVEPAKQFLLDKRGGEGVVAQENAQHLDFGRRDKLDLVFLPHSIELDRAR